MRVMRLTKARNSCNCRYCFWGPVWICGQIMKGISKNLRTRFSGPGLPTTSHSILKNVSSILPLSLAKEWVLKLILLDTNTIRALLPSHARPRSKEDVAHKCFKKAVFTFLRGKLALTLSYLWDYCSKNIKEILVPTSPRYSYLLLVPRYEYLIKEILVPRYASWSAMAKPELSANPKTIISYKPPMNQKFKRFTQSRNKTNHFSFFSMSFGSSK
jgi:hypothetical protein